jgi:hypothetical protein
MSPDEYQAELDDIERTFKRARERTRGRFGHPGNLGGYRLAEQARNLSLRTLNERFEEEREEEGERFGAEVKAG